MNDPQERQGLVVGAVAVDAHQPVVGSPVGSPMPTGHEGVVVTGQPPPQNYDAVGASVAIDPFTPQIYQDPDTGRFVAVSHSSEKLFRFCLALFVLSLVIFAATAAWAFSSDSAIIIVVVFEMIYFCTVVPILAFLVMSNSRKIKFDFNDHTVCVNITTTYTICCCNNRTRSIPYRALQGVELRPNQLCVGTELVLKVANGETFIIRQKSEQMDWQRRADEWNGFIASRRELVA